MKLMPAIRFTTAVVIAALCERGTSVGFSRTKIKGEDEGNAKIKIMLNSQKIANRLLACASSDKLKEYCKACNIAFSLDNFSKLIRELGYKNIDVSKAHALANEITGDFKRIHSWLTNPKNIDCGEDILNKIREFLQQLYLGNLEGIFVKYLEFMSMVLGIPFLDHLEMGNIIKTTYTTS